jgi:DNA-binding CsgD family transcriptional regulator
VLLERESELEQIERVVGDACAGRGRVVLIEGPAGIGKTRLLEAVRARARERGATVLSARASELDRDFPFGVLRQLFEPLLAGADGARRAGLLRGAAALAEPLLGEAAAGSADASLAHLHGMYWLVANLAEEGPAALVLDDLHWADAGSLRFLEFLVPRLEELPVLVALAARPLEPGAGRERIDALATDPSAIVLHPPPLGEAGVASLVAAQLGGSPEPGFSDACREATGGNPFLLRELLRELAADGVAPAAEAAPLVRQVAPPTVARAVLLRLARLGDDAAALARALAVLGDGSPLRRVAALASLPVERGAELAAALGRAGIAGASAPLGFAHPILRSAVYGEIDDLERSRAHRAAADLLAAEGAGPDALAVHLLPTEPAADPWVVATLREAAARAVSRGAAAAGVAFLRRALAEPPPPGERGELVRELAQAELHAGEPGAAAEHFAEASRVVADPAWRAGHAWEHALALQAIGRHDEAYALRERAADEVADVDPELALRIEASLIASACLTRSRLPWARERIERYRGRGSWTTPAEHRLLAVLAYLDAMYGDRPARSCAADAERALASGALIDVATGIASTPFFAAIETLWMADVVEPARRALDGGIEAAGRGGSALGFASLAGWRCMLSAREGRLSEAEADARSCMELSLPQGWFELAPPMLGFVLDVMVDRGAEDEAWRLLEATGTAARAAGDDLAFLPVVHARARLRAARRDMAGARADLAELDARRARWNTDLTLAPAVLVAPELRGETPPGDLERMQREAEAWGTPRAIGMALRARGLAEGGVSLLEEAVRVLAASPARLEHARAAVDLGAALRAAGRRDAARDALRLALDAADACGAVPLAERARAELRAAGARPRRARTSGVEALTASERRIAEMAAGGLSNPEIAQALFVTKKTVETHLGSAYRKLDIHSRAQLAGALRG